MVEFFMNIHTTSTAQCDANMNAVFVMGGEESERAMKCFLHDACFHFSFFLALHYFRH